MGGNPAYALDTAAYTIEEVAKKARCFLFEERFSKARESA